MGELIANRLMIRPDLISYLTLGFAIVAFVVWLIVRKRQRTLWLPTLRILDLEARKLPKLRWRVPPWLPFLCFVMSALMAVMLSYRPRQLKSNEYSTSNSRHHLLIDLSPSVAAHGRIEDIARKASDIWSQVSADAKVSVSTTHSPNFYEPQNAEELFEIIKQAGFHRGGIKIGEAVREMVEQIRGVDGLIVVSDNDKHSWDGFNWRTLLDEISISRFAIGAERHSLPNLYIDAVRLLPNSGAKIEWDVELIRVNSTVEISGALSAFIETEPVAEVEWSMPVDKMRTVVRMSLSQQKAKSLLANQNGSERVLRFEVSAGTDNSLQLDDTFRSRLAWHGNEAIIVAESLGERSLEDPTYHFESALSVLGFEIRRYEISGTKAVPFVDKASWFLIGGRTGETATYCPDTLERERLARMTSDKKSKSDTNVWLVPASAEADWRGMCHCISQLVVGQKAHIDPPDFCRDVDTRPAWIELLKSIGGKQVGGNVGSEGDAIAWQFSDARSGFRVLALTVPLSPNTKVGMSYAKIPMIIKSLLEFQGIVRKGRELVVADEWPRIDSLVSSVWSSISNPKQPPANFDISNVPLGESLMAESKDQELPPLWSDRRSMGRMAAAAREDSSDPWPFVQLANIVIAAMLLLELLSRVFRQLGLKRRSVSGILLMTLGWLTLNNPSAEAQVDIITIDRTTRGDGSVSNLAMEVESRTSIELARRIRNYGAINSEALREPWLWVSDRQDLIGKSGAFRSDIASWLYRGGFLVMPGKFTPEALKTLTSNMLKGRRDFGEWTPIPPDHELMRSFYLLDALPECDGNVWKGFQFDGRIAIIQPPFNLLNAVKDNPELGNCTGVVSKEQAVRIFVNITMVALATDYKKDQIHLPEILKRLR